MAVATRSTRTGRRSREERKALTRIRLLEAAAKVFARRGFDDASLDEIADEAGFTKGAVYSNFESKEDLFLTLLEQRCDDVLRQVEAMFEAARTPAETIRSVGAFMGGRVERDRDWCLLFFELWAFSVRNPRLRRRFAGLYASVRARIAELIEAQAGAMGVALPAPAEDLATAALALGDGFALQKLADPKAFPENFYASMLMLFFGALASAGRADVSAGMAEVPAGNHDQGTEGRNR